MSEASHWLRITRRDAPFVLIAPHGGRRPILDLADLRAELRVNDLHTAELTDQLAERLGATSIVNAEIDRNHIDLNRLSKVRRDAPWFTNLLAQEASRRCSLHARVTFVFVHGWNTGLPACDIGAGVRGIDELDGPRRTADRGFVQALFAGLSRDPETQVTIGSRYPASHPNNVVQAFGPLAEPQGDAEAMIRSLSSLGAVQAVQLELGVPLRWPGARRERFADRIAVALCDAQAGLAGAADERIASADEQVLGALQSYDAAAGIGVSLALGDVGTQRMGRVLFFLGGQRIALFTGEGARDRALPMLRAVTHADGVELAFKGPMLVLGEAERFIDLEDAMARSSLSEAEFAGQVAWDAGSHHWPGLRYGTLRGYARIGTQKVALAAPAVHGRMPVRVAGLAVRTAFTGWGEDRTGIGVRALVDGSVLAESFRDAAVEPFTAENLAVEISGLDRSPHRLSAATATGHFEAVPVNRMPIVRGLGKGSYLRVTFGVARWSSSFGSGFGMYEHTEPLMSAGQELNRPLV